jgi:hypothetical protein
LAFLALGKGETFRNRIAPKQHPMQWYRAAASQRNDWLPDIPDAAASGYTTRPLRGDTETHFHPLLNFYLQTFRGRELAPCTHDTIEGVSMEKLSTKVHGMIDYPTALTQLGVAPLMDGAESTTMLVSGAMSLINSLCTDYELGVVPLYSMRTHLIMDGINGALLALSPFVFGFSRKRWWPHVAIGLLEICAALLTKPESDLFPIEDNIDDQIESDVNSVVRPIRNLANA